MQWRLTVEVLGHYTSEKILKIHINPRVALGGKKAPTSLSRKTMCSFPMANGKKSIATTTDNRK